MRIILSPRVVSEPMDDGLCLLHMERGECHLLNAVGAHLWLYMEKNTRNEDEDAEGATVAIDDLVRAVEGEYGVSEDVALRDTKEFVEMLLSIDAIATYDGDGPEGSVDPSSAGSSK